MPGLPRKRTTGWVRCCAWIALLALAGCGEERGGAPIALGTGAPGGGSGGSLYSGPAPLSDDIQAFRLELWDPLRTEDRCGSCHGTGGQSPQFVRTDDVNLAYTAANTAVDLTSPAASRLVTKVAGGHNCWEAVDSVCADVITTYIAAWATASGASTATSITLTAPALREPGATLRLPDDASLFAAYVHPLLETHCAGCHREDAAIPQAPYFASPDVDAAYAAAAPRINLNTPSDSRLVSRLREEFHNCWSDCADDANSMEAAVLDMSQSISPTAPEPDLVTSKALSLVGDGVVASGGGRHEANQIALWQFKTGSGVTAYDTSGVDPAMHLTLSGTVGWVGGWGVQFTDGKLQASTATSRKLHDLIGAAGEYALEAWVAPANVTQEDAHIVGYSGANNLHNLVLAQRQYSYEGFNRSGSTDAEGAPALLTADADEDLQATLQHVVLNYDPIDGRRIYVNGVDTEDSDPVGGSGIAGWDDNFAFVLGNSVAGDRPWQGMIRMVAVHNRNLTLEQIQQNYAAGVGEKFYLLFGISHLIDVPEAFIVIEASQLDNYAYVLQAPYFLSLDPTAAPNGIAIKGMRIGINGRESSIGQTYTHLDTTLGGTAYTPGEGQPLSRLGTVIPMESGPLSDEFFLTFEQLGSESHLWVEAEPAPPTPPADRAPASRVAVRNFAEINASFSAITGVPTTSPGVAATYALVEQQLPAVEDINAFVSSHQIGVSQLAIEYCSAMVDDDGLRSAFFGPIDANADVASAFGSGDSPAKNLLVDALYNGVIGIGGVALSDAPSRDQLKDELLVSVAGESVTNGPPLFERLTAGCPSGCDATRTRVILKALCASTLASATVLLH